MITVHCDFCRNELFEPGGLLFSPPNGDIPDTIPNGVIKYHICTTCYKTLMSPATKIQISFRIHEDD